MVYSNPGTAVRGPVAGRCRQEELIKQQELLLKFLSKVREGSLAVKLDQESSPLVALTSGFCTEAALLNRKGCFGATLSPRIGGPLEFFKIYSS